MCPRKTPYKHKVSGHKRGDKWIDNYQRGSGNKPVRSSRKRAVGSKSLGFMGDYSVRLFYGGFDDEEVSVNADDYQDALKKGFNTASSRSQPVKIRLRNGR